jgi:hypothetical protein
VSFGSCGEPEADGSRATFLGSEDAYQEDLVFSDGEFVAYPDWYAPAR